MSDNTKIRILALELENFQSITNPIRIEFAPITMLYGPNSAGKSAIFDALELIKQIWDPRDSTKKSVNAIEQKLDLWAHIPKELTQQVRTTKIAIELRCEYHNFYEDEGSAYCCKTNGKDTYDSLIWADDLAERFDGKTLRFEIEAKKLNRNDEWNFTKISIAEIILANDEKSSIPIIEATKVTPDGTNLANPDLLGEFLAIKIYNGEHANLFNKFHKLSNEEFLSEGCPSLVLVDNQYLYATVDFWGCLAPSNYWFISALQKYALVNENSNTHTNFENVYLDIVSFFGGVLVDTIDGAFPIVRADRTIPSPDETIVMCEGVTLGDRSTTTYIEGQKIHHDHFIDMLSNQLPKKDHFYYQLALLARYHKIYWDASNADFIALAKNGKKISIDPRKEELAQFDLINKYLSDYLFSEKGYQVTSDIRFLASIDAAFTDLNETELILSPALVRLLLIDGDGRKVEIQDVGSGIAFVLPLLVSLATQNICAIQQPELHIHPALQACLADVFIDRQNIGKEFGWQSLIETHSEHLLLRLLRRIRESNKNSSTDSRIEPKDISIYYLNPTPAGTEARKMLITPLGDFYNTWPRGFFGERARDLFDE